MPSLRFCRLPPAPSVFRRRIVRYVATSSLSFVVNFGAAAATHELAGLPPEAAGAIGLTLSFLVNFVTLRLFVFASRGAVGGEMARFALTSAAFRLGEYGVFLVLHTGLGIYYLLALFVTAAAATIVKYVAYRALVFAPRPETAPTAPSVDGPASRRESEG